MRTFIECRRGSDDAERHRAEWQELGNAYDDLATAIQTGDTAKQTKENDRIDAAIKAVSDYDPVPSPCPTTTGDEDLVIALAEKTAFAKSGTGWKWRSDAGKALRLVLPILNRLRGAR
jgi:hypothetical protein